MPKTPNASAMDALQKELGPMFKARGYRKRARNYSRQTSDGMSHCIQFQMGNDPFGEPDGLGESLSGMFTVNVGVFIPECAAIMYSWTSITFPTEVYCTLRLRVGELLCEGQSERDDIWYNIPDESENAELAEYLRNVFEGIVFPFLDHLETREDYLYAMRHKKTHGSTFCLLSELDGAIICANQGQPDQALKFLATYCELYVPEAEPVVNPVMDILGVPTITPEKQQEWATEDACKLAKKLGLAFDPKS